MPYVYNCDGWCDSDGRRYDDRPALTAEFNEEWVTTTRRGGEILSVDYDPGDLITLCPTCTHRLLLET